MDGRIGGGLRRKEAVGPSAVSRGGRREGTGRSDVVAIMSTVVGYVMQEMPTGRRVLADFRTDPKIERLFVEGQRLRSTVEG